jgi:type IV pilus assembly protein PilN
MIRINLTAGERKAVKVTSGGGGGRTFQIGQKVTVAGMFLLIVTVLLIGWRYLAVAQDQAQLTRDIDAARREETRLGDVLKQVADFQAAEVQLQARIALIKELKQGQSAPVHMIDQVSLALLEMTWLVSLKQVGYDVTIEGRCLALTSLSDFVNNLEASRYFKRPVDIIETSVMPSVLNKPDLIKFVIKGTFQMAGIQAIPVGTPAAKPKPGAKPTAKPAAKGARGGN